MSHPLIKKAISQLPPKSPKPLEQFIKCFYDGVASEDLEEYTATALAEKAQTQWALLCKRKKNKPEIKIKTYVPSEEEAHLGRTVIDMVNNNMPFLVDSIAAMLTNEYKLIHMLIHPILHITYDSKNVVTKVSKKQSQDSIAQSHVHIELQGAVPAAQTKKLKEDLLRILDDVYYATRDWLAMKDRLRLCQKSLSNAPASEYCDADIEEYIYFLEYLYRDNFTLLGYREYKFTQKNGKISSKTVKSSSLGLLHDDMTPVYINEADSPLPDNLQELRYNLPPVFVSKVNKRATVHRPVPIDAIAVKKFDKKGNIVGEYLFLGLFTSVTYSRSIQDIPLLRQKTEQAMLMSGYTPNSHDHKALSHILEKYPRDEFFQTDVKELLETSISILRLQERQRIALYTRPDPFGRYVSCLVYVPRERYDTRLRKKMYEILEGELQGVCGNFNANMDDSTFARALFTIYISQNNPPKYDVGRMERRLQEAGRLWSERLSLALYDEVDKESEVLRIVSKYGKAFPANYTERYKAKQSYYDILNIESVLKTNKIHVELYKAKNTDDAHLRLKLFQRDNPVSLSSVLPLLENMGLSAISEDPYEVKPNDGNKSSVWVHDFLVEVDPGARLDSIKNVKTLFEKALFEAWYNNIENDSLNKLVLFAQMAWRDVLILRSYVRYLRQMRYHYDTAYIETTLTSNAQIAKELVDLFKAYHNPAEQKEAEKLVKKHTGNIHKLLEDVPSLDQDRIIRSLINLIESTLRTNFYQKDKNGQYKSYLSIKMDSKNILDLVAPKPYREIFVYSTRMEGVHLRGDAIARGGIRWSDRNEDFRTEILGLMKAQQVKNSVIVPMGAKGGFILKNPPPRSDRDAFLAEGIECYKTLIRGLLDITDNRKEGRIIPPKNVVRRDKSDPYLVVAADKGTATFSDIANSLSQDYGFWLDDAFASGGSAGYDHKIMGITARGAWESVKRHFRELNHDTQTQDFDVIGVGDMGGDVFGNGMLLSEHIKLIGAFNHMHIFCDPDPDTASSFKERKRLFKAVKGWGDYDTSLLSKGGRIFDRSDKSLHLTPEIKSRFDIDKDQVPPAVLMKAMLKARTDLLWFGGIGTYIKASSESDASVGDKGNDPIRINGSEVKARVLGEGANLAITQLGRIEFASKGGAINADFIDNSGGVDSSDHEVNIKILMADIMTNGNHTMGVKKRNNLLEKMTEEVSRLVLNNNYQQAQGISLMRKQAADNLGLHALLIEDFENEIGLNRELEGLPSEEDIEARLRAGSGLTRPELGLLQSYSKIEYTRDLLKTDIPDQEHIEDEWLVNYFPKPLRVKYLDEIKSHRLKREIIATKIATNVINRMGPTFIHGQVERTNATIGEVTEAFLTVCDVFGLKELWKSIENLDNIVPAQVQINAMQELQNLADRETHWFLTRLGRPVDMDNDIHSFGLGVQNIRNQIDKIATKELGQDINRRIQMGMNDGLPKDLAQDIAIIPILGAACDIIRSSLDCHADITLTAKTYLEIGHTFHINWLTKQAQFMKTDDRWSEEALFGLTEQLYTCQAALTTHILQTVKGVRKSLTPGESLVSKWIEKNQSKIHSLEPLMADMRASGSVDIPMLIIAEQRLRQLYNG